MLLGSKKQCPECHQKWDPRYRVLCSNCDYERGFFEWLAVEYPFLGIILILGILLTFFRLTIWT